MRYKMNDKLLETKCWLENFSSRWEKVLVRSTCASRNSRSNMGLSEVKRSPDVQSLDGIPRLSPADFAYYAEDEIENIRGRFADANRLLRHNKEDLEDQQSTLHMVQQKTHSIP